MTVRRNAQTPRNPRRVSDPLFFLDPKSRAYRPIDADAYARIVEGSIRL